MKTVEQLKDMQNYGYSFSDLWTLDEIVSMLINKVNEVIEGYENFVQVPHIKGNFNKNEDYKKFDLVNYNGETYICKHNCYAPTNIKDTHYFDKLSYDMDVLKEAISHYNSIEEWDKYFTETSGKIEEKYTIRLNGIDKELEKSLDGYKPNWSVWEEFNQRELNVNWFGAKGDGITNDTIAIQKAIDSAKYGIYFPNKHYIYDSLSFDESKNGFILKGEKHSILESTKNSGNMFNVGCEQLRVNNLTIKGNENNNETLTMFMDTRTSLRSDFDIKIENCFLMGANNIVVTKGRGIELINNLITNFQKLITINYPPNEPQYFEPGSAINQSYENGLRAIRIINNRIHYPNKQATLLTTNTLGSKYLKGVEIQNNYLEGNIQYLSGGCSDFNFKNNLHFQIGNLTNLPLFDVIESFNNVNIDININTYGANTIYKVIKALCEVNNITIKGNINHISSDVFQFNNGGSNINIDVIADNICMSEGSFIRKIGTGNFNGLNVKGVITSPNDNFIVINCNGDTIGNDIDLSNLTIKNNYSKLLNLYTINNGSFKKISGSYTGNGGTQTINLKYKPSLVFIVGENVSSLTSETIPGLTLTSSSIIVSGTQFNTDGKKYNFIVN